MVRPRKIGDPFTVAHEPHPDRASFEREDLHDGVQSPVAAGVLRPETGRRWRCDQNRATEGTYRARNRSSRSARNSCDGLKTGLLGMTID